MAGSPPSKILLIRHGEKPADPPDENGPRDIREDGTPGKGHSLIVPGWQRAGALIGFFAPYNATPANSFIAVPDYIYAANPQGESERPAETVTPLARWLNYAPGSSQFTFSYSIGKDEEKLVDDVLQLSGNVLICWEHKNIYPNIVSHINDKYPISNYSEMSKWPDLFGLVWVLDYNSDQGQYTWNRTAQNLMPDDLRIKP